jgi:threonine dehydrogenase-like Zn-dependent dehydrogenase
MPKEVLAVAPGTFVMKQYEDTPLKPNEIRIRSQLSSEKHGTMLPIYRGNSVVSKKIYNPELGLFFIKESTREMFTSFSMNVGNMTVGIVSEVGIEVESFKVGDKVYGYLPIRETHTVTENKISLAPKELSNEELVCIDPGTVALLAVREGNVKIGERVAIFGLGAIGLMAIQIAKISGATSLFGIEFFEKRRNLAQKYGADILFNPKSVDIGLAIKKTTRQQGVDISIETSGSYQALQQSIRSTRYGGTIVPVSAYHSEAKDLNLGEEWHFNRQIMVSGARVESEPYRDFPRWDKKRVYETVIELLRQKKLKVEGLLDPIVNFNEAIKGYRMIDKEPEKTINLGVKYE